MSNQKLSRRRFLGLSAAAAGSLFASSFPRFAFAQDATALTYKGTSDFWDWEFAPRQEYYKQLITEWQDANPGITLNYTTFPYGDLGTKLLTANEANQNPAISNVHSEWRPALQKSGLLAPYPDDLFTDFDKLASTPFLRAMDGKIYTTTFGYYCNINFFNTDMLKEAGVTVADVPKTWKDFVDFAKNLTKYDANGNVERPGVALNHYYSQRWLWQDLIYQAGGFLYDEEGKKALWDSDESVAALQFIADWYHVHKIDDPLLERHFDMFQTERAAGFISHGYWAGDLISDATWEGKWDTTSIATWGGTGLPAWGMVAPEEGPAVFANYPADVQAAMFSFLKHALGSDEKRIKWALIHAIPTDRVDLLDNQAFKDNDEGNVIRSQGATIPYRVNPGEQPLEADTYWREMLDRVITNKEEPKAVLTDVTKRFNETMATAEKPYLITERSYVAPKS